MMLIYLMRKKVKWYVLGSGTEQLLCVPKLTSVVIQDKLMELAF